MSGRALLTAGVLAGSVFLLPGLTSQRSPLMSAEPATKKAAPIPTESAGAPIGTAELAILKALAEPIELDLVDEPLQNVMDFLSEQHKIEIVFDLRALEDVNAGPHVPITVRLSRVLANLILRNPHRTRTEDEDSVPDVPITFQASRISLRSGLDLILRDLDLTWMIDSEVLLITSRDEADLRLATKTYDVGDLVLCQDEDGRPWDDYDSLINIITESVEPDTWEETTGGPGTIEGRTFASAKVLVVRQTCQAHLGVAELLDTIRTVVKAHGTDAEPPVREQPPPYRHRAEYYGPFGGGMRAGTPTDKPADAAEKPSE